MSEGAKPHRPDINVPPPLIFLAGLVTGWLLDRLVMPFAIASAVSRWQFALGTVLIVLGAMLAAWGAGTFRRRGTSMLPFRPASAMVVEGPYRFTRNPMYVGMTLAYLGATALVDSWWPLLVLPVVLWTLVRVVITREEAYLAAIFGEEYEEYRRRVRRWI